MEAGVGLGHPAGMIAPPELAQLNEAQLRELAVRLIDEVRLKQTAIDKLTHEMAVLKRLKFAARSEAFHGETLVLGIRTPSFSADYRYVPRNNAQAAAIPSVHAAPVQP
jgi:hypothetical protein